MHPEGTPLDGEEFKSEVRSTLEHLGLQPVIARTPPARVTRSGGARTPAQPENVVTLAQDDAGVLRWRWDAPDSAGEPPKVSRALPTGRIIQQFAFEQLAPNAVNTRLNDLDQWLTPQRGLRRWNPQAKQLDPFPDGSQAAGKRVLLFIHGTFSNCDSVIAQVRLAPHQAGDALLARAAKKYDLVLTYDHPTVGVSPVMNAFDLAALLRPAPAELHIVCHSRGGLVTRWFLEGFATDELRRQARAVMVATSIGGTSLAAPARITASLDYLANVGRMLSGILKLGGAHPFLGFAGVMTQIISSAVRFTSRTPVFDAAVALVPGFQGQARIGNNAELLRLRSNTGAAIKESGIRYYAVRADFQPEDAGWNFLKYFSKPMQRTANFGADLVFDSANDLVVDCASMDDLADTAKIEKVLDFGVTATVHHTNYFQQERTLKFIADSLEL